MTLRGRVRPRDMPGVGAALLHHVLAVVTGRYRHSVGANALVTDTEGRLLMVHTSYPPRRWDLPGGRVERHESPLDALKREVEEEAGLVVAPGRLLLVDATLHGRLTLVFACTVEGGDARPGVGEITALTWMTRAELDDLEPAVRRRVLAALEETASIRLVTS